MKLSVELLGITLTIQFVDDLSIAYGDYNASISQIRLVRGLHRDTLLLTFTHELVHVKQYLYGHEMSEDEANQDALFWYTILKHSSLFESVWEHYQDDARRANGRTQGHEGESQGEEEEGLAASSEQEHGQET